MNDEMRTPAEVAARFRETAISIQRTLLDILAIVKQEPSEATEALGFVDGVIANMQANQASMIEHGRQLMQPSIDNAIRVRNEIAAICPKLN
jgi:hypothetical protein